MGNEPVTTPIQTKYAEQLAADLAVNRAEQAEVVARLERLKAEEKWLTATLESMPVIAPEKDAGPVNTGASAREAVEAAVPQPREARGLLPAKKAAVRKTAARRSGKTAPEKTGGKTAAAGVKKTTVQQPAGPKTTDRKTSAGGAKKSATGGVESVKLTVPTLGELLVGLLARQPGEPKKVSEIYAELEAARPERATSQQVVRNALEKLVAKDGLEKDSRQGVVLYTWPVPDASAATAPGAAAAEPVEAVTAGI
ncbi:hypothetical protein ACFVZH_21080 [Streptomyces sp. NPDC059534]|uniref:hypothetical protein n=1 Tax=Streptomyces sp. NPDC059534 TaxID=3346859 RepID=UPI0036A331D0